MEALSFDVNTWGWGTWCSTGNIVLIDFFYLFTAAANDRYIIGKYMLFSTLFFIAVITAIQFRNFTYQYLISNSQGSSIEFVYDQLVAAADFFVRPQSPLTLEEENCITQLKQDASALACTSIVAIPTKIPPTGQEGASIARLVQMNAALGSFDEQTLSIKDQKVLSTNYFWDLGFLLFKKPKLENLINKADGFDLLSGSCFVTDVAPNPDMWNVHFTCTKQKSNLWLSQVRSREKWDFFC